MNGYQSIATITGPEFINLQPMDISPLISKCEIKVLYIGKNRNRTSFDKATAAEMAKTLRGVPIVGYYKKDKQDFRDHGNQMVLDGDGIHFNTLTKPYGFVAPDAKVWFQDFQDTDDDGTSTIRTYLMTTGYLWTGQFEEAKQILDDGGKPQSMELDEESMQGFWSKEVNEDYEFFIVNDAIFSKLCALGDDIEPCFEGSSITAPEISKTFSLDDEFRTTLFSMMKELQETLQGGKETVAIEEKQVETQSTVAQGEPITNEATAAAPEVAVEAVEEAPAVAEEAIEETAASIEAEEPVAENSAEILDNSVEEVAAENDNNIEATSEFEKKEDTEEKKEEDDSEKGEEDKKDDEDKKEKDYALIKIEYDELQKSHAELQTKFTELSEEIERLRSYKAEVESKEKDALIAEFYMLSDSDKEDVIAHKAEYTLDEIKSKLAILCFEKKVSYASANDTKVDMTGMTVNTQYAENVEVPEWLQAVDRYNENK